VNSLAFFTLAAFFEIAGCFGFWLWLRSGHTVRSALAGIVCLIIFASALTRVESPFAGRAFAAYGGIYIAASLIWLRSVEHVHPDRWDVIGAGLCIAGTLVILLAPR
jgi:small multidrug resistance family-3 protein